MKLPNKVIHYNDSVISKFPAVLKALQKQALSPIALFNTMRTQLDDVSDFTDILVCLFALNKIDFTDDGRLTYVTT
ncbi:MAG: hypothetical protein FWE03_00155 [Firmicutes bacterium]|nr:hypothetical protein [Bacillota bacterium]